MQFKLPLCLNPLCIPNYTLNGTVLAHNTFVRKKEEVKVSLLGTVIAMIRK